VSLQPHQQRVTDEAAAAAAAGVPYRKLLKWQMGGGKSLGGISVAESLGRPYSVVAPAGVRPTLNAEIARFTDQATPHEVFSYAAAARGRRPAPGTGTLVVDEAQALGSPSARARAVGDMAARADNLILMSGTPVRNDPAEFAPILAALTGRHVSQDDFRRRYVGTEFDRPGGIVGRLLGRPAAEREVLTNQDELKQLLAGKVDYYAPPAAAAAVKDETIETPLTKSQTALYQAMWGKLPAILRFKLRFNYPLSADELRRYRSFMTGPRQLALSDLPFQPRPDAARAFENSGKLRVAFDNLRAHLAPDPRTKAIVYSNFPTAGLDPYAAALAKANIPHAVFHGGLNDAQRKELVDGFNANRLRVALVGPAGAEGISLKGSQLIQLLDPYWNEARTRQARARGIRFDSHTGLPEDLRGVTVQKYVATLPPGVKDRLLQAVGIDRTDRRETVDHYLTRMSEQKELLNRQLDDLLKEVGSAGAPIKKAGLSPPVLLAAADAPPKPPPLVRLLRAKALSDAGDYRGKAEIVRAMVAEAPHEWVVDSDAGHVVGLTHVPLGFRLHLPKRELAGTPLARPAAAA
jgi:hypothetical protein